MAESSFKNEPTLRPLPPQKESQIFLIHFSTHGHFPIENETAHSGIFDWGCDTERFPFNLH